MGSGAEWALLLCVTIFYAFGGAGAHLNVRCTTSSNEPGRCKHSRDCPAPSEPNTPQSRFLGLSIKLNLQSLSCGIIYICCPEKYLFPQKYPLIPSTPKPSRDHNGITHPVYINNGQTNGGVGDSNQNHNNQNQNGNSNNPGPNYNPNPINQQIPTTRRPSIPSTPETYTNYYSSPSTPQNVENNEPWPTVSTYSIVYPSTSKRPQSNAQIITTTTKPSTSSANFDDVQSSENLLPSKCGIGSPDRIVGGSATAMREYPWMVALEFRTPKEDKKMACGGSLITNQHILTAAHCIKGLSIPRGWSLVSVRLGEWDTRTNPDCNADTCANQYESIPVKEAIVHELYDPIAQHNDIGIIFMDRPVEFSHDIKPICLPTNDGILPKLTVAGWGRNETSEYSEKLLQVRVPHVSLQSCGAIYKDRNTPVKLTDDQLCAGGEESKDSCVGDSGGPLMQISPKDPKYYVVGVVSFGPRICGTAGWPGVYTNVYKYKPWLLEKIKETNSFKDEISPNPVKDNPDVDNSHFVFPEDFQRSSRNEEE
ncbi:hypothetical protein QAD02_010130 [Eretmocerus hayati]|uniref:Uncharacterized protein n=1 Tax=Eretmocerus hayati TaxID=131215 RepID=A0ACC2NBJ8_9HYME|nr:hypothetical protein QAD02_010130 [Eretmocerus hayati]